MTRRAKDEPEPPGGRALKRLAQFEAARAAPDTPKKKRPEKGAPGGEAEDCEQEGE